MLGDRSSWPWQPGASGASVPERELGIVPLPGLCSSSQMFYETDASQADVRCFLHFRCLISLPGSLRAFGITDNSISDVHDNMVGSGEMVSNQY